MRTGGILICVPAYGQNMAAQTAESLFTLAQFLTVNQVRHQLTWMSAADIVEVRNLFLTVWYDALPQFSHMLFVDADMGFPPQLVRDMLKFNKPLVGTFYARRQMPASVVGATLNAEHSTNDMKQGHILANYVGCGVMLIQRSMVREMLDKKPELIDALPSVLANATPHKIDRLIRAFDPILQDNRRLSEDVSFCHRWREECGGEIWANIDYQIDHVGPFNFHLRYAGVLEAKERAA